MKTKNNNQKYIFWFTLVELIVVITILWILWAVWFLSFQWQTKNARNTTRMSDLSNLEKWLSSFRVTSDYLPLPENYITIQWSWTVIGYQWDAWDSVLSQVNFNWEWTDPASQTYYIYRIDENKTRFQIMVFLETELSYNHQYLPINIAHASTTDYSTREWYSEWTALWILLTDDNTPLHEVTDSSYFDDFATKTVDIIWWNLILKAVRIHLSNEQPLITTSVAAGAIANKVKLFAMLPNAKDDTIWIKRAIEVWRYVANTTTTLSVLTINDTTWVIANQTISWNNLTTLYNIWVSNIKESSTPTSLWLWNQTSPTAPVIDTNTTLSFKKIAWWNASGTTPSLTTADTTPTVTWDAVWWATSYEVSYTPSWWSPISLEVSSTEFTPPVAIDSWNITITPKRWSIVWQTSTVTLVINPSAPLPAPAPLYSSLTTPETKPVIRWDPVPWATSYQVTVWWSNYEVPWNRFVPPQAVNMNWATVTIAAKDGVTVSTNTTNVSVTIDWSSVPPPNVENVWVVADTTPTITWPAVPWAVRYKIKIDNQVVISDLTTPSFTPSSPLISWGHIIEVIAINASSVESQATPIDVVVNTSIPETPELLEVWSTTDSTPTITWWEVLWAERYEVYVDWVKASTSPIAPSITLPNLSVWSYTVEVIAVNSEWAKSTTDAISVEVVNPALTAPTPSISTANNTVTGDATPTISWADVWADSYEVYIDWVKVWSNPTSPTYTPSSDLDVWWHNIVIVAVKWSNKSIPVEMSIIISSEIAAPISIAWVCWSDNWWSLTSSPSNSCSAWSIIELADGWVWNNYTWKCQWTNWWATSSVCTASHSASAVAWVCWDDNWWALTASPSNPCSAWTIIELADGWAWSNYTWKCQWTNWGATSSVCTANHDGSPLNVAKDTTLSWLYTWGNQSSANWCYSVSIDCDWTTSCTINWDHVWNQVFGGSKWSASLTKWSQITSPLESGGDWFYCYAKWDNGTNKIFLMWSHMVDDWYWYWDYVEEFYADWWASSSNVWKEVVLPPSGTCWADNWWSLTYTPASPCSTWTITELADGWAWNNYTWKCQWANWGGNSPQCSATHFNVVGDESPSNVTKDVAKTWFTGDSGNAMWCRSIRVQCNGTTSCNVYFDAVWNSANQESEGISSLSKWWEIASNYYQPNGSQKFSCKAKWDNGTNIVSIMWIFILNPDTTPSNFYMADGGTMNPSETWKDM